MSRVTIETETDGLAVWVSARNTSDWTDDLIGQLLQVGMLLADGCADEANRLLGAIIADATETWLPIHRLVDAFDAARRTRTAQIARRHESSIVKGWVFDECMRGAHATCGQFVGGYQAPRRGSFCACPCHPATFVVQPSPTAGRRMHSRGADA